MHNKKYLRWKSNYLSHEGAQAQWDRLNDNKDLTVTLKWDNKSTKSVTDGYQWNKAHDLTAATVTLAEKTGDTSFAMPSDAGYIHGSGISNGADRQAYVVAHEFAHIEFAQQPGAEGLLTNYKALGDGIKDLEKQVGPTAFGNIPWAVRAEQLVDQTHYQLEKNADQRAWEVLGDTKP
jgi:hypothetical protein